MSGRQVQDILNQPFEFKEVLLSPRERAKVQKGFAAEQLFKSTPGRLEVAEFRLRELSVRLRTINNACDTGASLPDGTHITEVSLYGSRDRQYLLGPYEAVKRLMAGELPSKKPLVEELKTRAHILDVVIANLDGFLGVVQDRKKVTNISMESLFSYRYVGFGNYGSTVPSVSLRPPELTECSAVQLWSQDASAIQDARDKMLELKAELCPPIAEVLACENWWMPWTQEATDLRKHWENIALDVTNRAVAITLEFYEKVRSTDSREVRRQA